MELEPRHRKVGRLARQMGLNEPTPLVSADPSAGLIFPPNAEINAADIGLDLRDPNLYQWSAEVLAGDSHSLLSDPDMQRRIEHTLTIRNTEVSGPFALRDVVDNGIKVLLDEPAGGLNSPDSVELRLRMLDGAATQTAQFLRDNLGDELDL